MREPHPPTVAAAHERIAAVRPAAYARTRNAIDGAVSGLSPYITHGIVAPADVLAGVITRHDLTVQHKFVYELGWRGYFRHVWHHRRHGILHSLWQGPLPDAAYARELPVDIRQGTTGVPVVDRAVRALYADGMLHNHARMWLASYVVHLRKVHWRCGADWFYGHVLDGDLASNHLSWQWVAGTASRKPYLFNAGNVARYAPVAWHSPGSGIDASYEALDLLARQPVSTPAGAGPEQRDVEPPLFAEPPCGLGTTPPDPALAAGRDVWIVHPWNLGKLPVLPPGTLVLGLFVANYHRVWPWSERRWRFASTRMAELAPHRWYADAKAIGAALSGARRVRSVHEPHLEPWLARWAELAAAPALFAPVGGYCDSFSGWWIRTTRGLHSAADLLAAREDPAW